MILDSVNIHMYIFVIFMFILLYLCETDIMIVIVCMIIFLLSVFHIIHVEFTLIYIALAINPQTQHINTEQLCVNHSQFSACFHNLHPIWCELGDWCWGRELHFKMGLVNTNFPAAGGQEIGLVNRNTWRKQLLNNGNISEKTKMTMEQKTPVFHRRYIFTFKRLCFFLVIVMLVVWSVMIQFDQPCFSNGLVQPQPSNHFSSYSKCWTLPQKWRGNYLQIIYGSCFFQKSTCKNRT